MGDYTDGKGAVYAIQAGYTSGDVVILSDDGAAWRVQKSVLTEASPVFRDMFSNATSDTKEVNLPDVSCADLSTFLSAITQTQPPTGLDISQTGKAIDLLCRYECNEAARTIIFHNIKKLEAHELFEAFALASRLNDIMSACRVLAQGHVWYLINPNGITGDDVEKDPAEASLRPISARRRWDAQDAARVQSSWMWALTVATSAVERILNQLPASS